jgi:hypothetical protein
LSFCLLSGECETHWCWGIDEYWGSWGVSGLAVSVLFVFLGVVFLSQISLLEAGEREMGYGHAQSLAAGIFSLASAK